MILLLSEMLAFLENSFSLLFLLLIRLLQSKLGLSPTVIVFILFLCCSGKTSSSFYLSDILLFLTFLSTPIAMLFD